MRLVEGKGIRPSPQVPAKILFVAVHYKSGRSMLALLESLRGLDQFHDSHVVVVDNCSGEEHLSVLRDAVAHTANVELLEARDNRGYFGGARLGFDHYLAQGNHLPEFVVVCNHDIVITQTRFIARLLEQETSSVGAIAPRIQVLPEGTDQNPFMERRPGRFRWTGLRLVSSSYGLAALWDWMSRHKRMLNLFRKRIKYDPTPRPIYAPHGSFFIFTKGYFEAGGYLDSNLFLFGEEISVAEICRAIDLVVKYEPSMCVLHNEHLSTGKRISRFTYDCQRRALRYLTRTYFSRVKLPASSCNPDCLS